MLQNASRKFRGACMMLMREGEDQLSFLGTAFLVHPSGYLLTAAHLVSNTQGLRIVPTAFSDDFIPMTFDRVAAMSVSVVSKNTNADVALLKLEQELAIEVPDDFVGATQNVRPGASIMTVGYSFGHEQLHTTLNFNGVVAAKIQSPNGTRLILFDKMVNDGDVGGPLVHVHDGHIVGVISGRFEPAETVRGSDQWDRSPPRDTTVAFAVAIEYGLELMAAEGLHGNY
ncbi:MAG: serine protease [Gammaproteobacteria bacterium]